MMNNDNPKGSTCATAEHLKNRESVSALADGQLRGKEFARVVDLVGDDADARASWHAYHWVGDVMRSSDGLVGRDVTAEGDFVARFRTRLQQELANDGMPCVSAAPESISKIIANNSYLNGTSGLISSEKPSANDSSFRWKLLAGVASIAAVLAVSWTVMANVGLIGTESQLAQAAPGARAVPVIAQATTEPPIMIRDPHLDALLAAHKQFGGTSALQMPAGFLRNATFEGPAR